MKIPVNSEFIARKIVKYVGYMLQACYVHMQQTIAIELKQFDANEKKNIKNGMKMRP